MPVDGDDFFREFYESWKKRIMRKTNFVIQSMKASFFHSFCIVDGDCHVMAGDYTDGQKKTTVILFFTIIC